MGDMKSDATGLPASMAGVQCHEKVRELISRFLPEPSLVADMAAGEGAFSIILSEMGHKVFAVDADRANWKANGIKLHNLDLDSEFAERIPSIDNRFDAIVAIEIIEHLENPFRFVRECGKLLKPGGLLFLTTPNVESVQSRLIFLYSGRLSFFGAYETVRPAHITPIFRWKLDMILAEANFEMMHEDFNRHVYASGSNLKGKIAAVIGRLIEPFLKGNKGGEGRIIVARRVASV
jgi:2-polyprenyl-3-methyl-5-hydroxy-6-metoxy-1,4-benzoquinol methylase